MDKNSNFSQDFLDLIRVTREPERIEEILKDSFLYYAANQLGTTLLHYSACYNNENLTKHLLDKGFDVNIQDSRGITPLMIAAMANHAEVMKMLLSAGADIFKLNNEKKGVFHMLNGQRTLDAINGSIRQLQEKCSNYEEIAKKLHNARCPLHQAVALKNFKVIEYMIKRGSPVNSAHPVLKVTALHEAVVHEDFKGLMMLLKHGADVNALDHLNESPLCKLYGNDTEHTCKKLDILSTLVKHGAAMTTCTRNGVFQVYNILTKGNYKVIQTLIRKGLDFNVRDTASEKTVLHCLAKNLNPRVVEELERHTDKFDVDVRDKFGQTPLLFAAHEGNVGMVKFLLKQGAKTDVEYNTRGTTPLYYAYERVKEGFEEQFRQCGELLLHYNADPQFIIITETGEIVTIFDEALQTGNIDRIKPVVAHLAMLEKRGTPITKTTRAKINSHDKLKKYFDNCRQLLEKKVYERVILFDLLSCNSRKMAQYLNSKKILRKLRKETYMGKIMKYQYYFSVLNKRCWKGKNFMKLKTIAARIICKIFENRIDKQHLIIDNVTGYLNDQSLKNLCQLYHQLGSYRQRTYKSSNDELVSEIRQKKRSRKKHKNRKKQSRQNVGSENEDIEIIFSNPQKRLLHE